jgi:regulator of RNase E activity RraA
MLEEAREHIGSYVPKDALPADFPRAAVAQLAALRALSGLTSTVADALESFGFNLSVAASSLRPRHSGEATVVGQAVTLRYLPERTSSLAGTLPSRLGHGAAVTSAAAGDVLVVDACGIRDASCFGGLAAHTAKAAGIAGALIDGAVRDLDEIETTGLPVWAATVTPRTGNRKLEAAAINQPITCSGVQVRPGDVVVADRTGICFIPIDALEDVINRVLDIAQQEANLLSSSR